MSFLKGLGGPLAGGLGGAITPASGLGMAGGPMSGLGLLEMLFGGKDKGGGGESATPPAVAAPTAPAAPPANAAATGLGRLIGADPARISSIARSVGGGMNQIAAAGGAQEGYAAPELPAVNNHMQLMDPKILQALVQYFRPSARGQNQMEQF